MVEIDSDTYQVKTMRADSAAPRRFLITPERQQNLELLRHLLENTDHSIVLCGPEGVGKTGLLEVLQKRIKDDLRWCSIKGHAALSFEEIHERVGPFLRHGKLESQVKPFGQSRPQDLPRNVALLIDDAGDIAPGLVGRMIELAEDHPDLRVIFVLTHDQWHIKDSSDPAIESCYIVEMKPLTPKDCRAFVQHLASLAPSLRFRNGLTDGMIDSIYLETHGIPSRIIARFPELNRSKEGMDPLIILIFAVAGLVSLALAVQWFTASRPIVEQEYPTAISGRSSSVIDLNPPFLSLPIGDDVDFRQKPVLSGAPLDAQEIGPKAGQTLGDTLKELPPMGGSSTTGLPENHGESGNPSSAANNTFPETLHDQDVFEPAASSPVTEADAEDWLASLPENSYSLQLMAVSKEATVEAVIARYPELKKDLRYFRRSLNGKPKFVLLYGSFSNPDSAKAAKSTLPAEFGLSLLRKISAIKKEFPPASKARP